MGLGICLYLPDLILIKSIISVLKKITLLEEIMCSYICKHMYATYVYIAMEYCKIIFSKMAMNELEK